MTESARALVGWATKKGGRGREGKREETRRQRRTIRKEKKKYARERKRETEANSAHTHQSHLQF